MPLADVVLRDAHQSLATRLRLDDMLPIAAQLSDDARLRVAGVLGAATLDACIRFLGEDPCGCALCASLKGHAENPAVALLRARTCPERHYRHYADDVVERFVERAVKTALDVFRCVFDAMNDPRI